MTQNMKVTKTKKTSIVQRNLEPSFNQSFDFKLDKSLISNTFLTLQLKQARFAVKGRQSWQTNKLLRQYCLFQTLVLAGPWWGVPCSPGAVGWSSGTRQCTAGTRRSYRRHTPSTPSRHRSIAIICR